MEPTIIAKASESLSATAVENFNTEQMLENSRPKPTEATASDVSKLFDEAMQPDGNNNNEIKDAGSEVTEKLNPESLQPEEFSTRNSWLEGKNHQETDVPFETDIVKLDDKTIEGVFPNFQSEAEINLPKEMYNESDFTQFRECNNQLAEQVENDPDLANKFNSNQLEQIKNFDNPDGYTWHHHQQPGRMQLVDTKIHALTGHTGGQAIWS